MESRILSWFQNPGREESLFLESRAWGWILKGWRIPEKFSSAARWLLAGLLFLCIFVPRFSIGSITPFYRIDLRAEDILLALTVFLTLGGVGRRDSVIEIPSVEKAFLGFLIAAQISILNGFFFQTIDKPFISLLYLAKWIEYFFVFVVTARLATTEKDFDRFLKVFFFLGVGVAIFGYWEHFFPQAKAVYPNYYRLFERPPFHGDANHIGGLLVLWLGFFSGLFLKSKDRRIQWQLVISILFVFFPFIWTYSRKSYFALAGALLFPLFVKGTQKKLLFLVSLLIILGLLLPTRLAERLLDLGEAFGSTDPFHSSWAGNWVMWKEALWNFDPFFLLGSGIGSRHRLFYESQYILVLAETGIVGVTAFIFLCLAMVREITSRMPRLKGTKEEGLALAWLMGFVGLLIHNASCVSWTVAKVAIPFWFLTAVVFTQIKQVSISR